DAVSFRRAALVLTSAGIIHLIPIVLVNSSPERAERRLLDLDIQAGTAESIIASRALEKRDYQKSEKYYRIAAEKDSTRSEVFYRLGELNLRKEEYFDAVSNFGKALRLQKDNPEYRFALANAYIEAEWFADAAEQLRILTERFESNPLYWTKLGYALNHSGEYGDAVRAYRRALLFDPESSEYRENLYSAMLNRGSELQEEGEYEKAEELYLKAISMVPVRWEGYFNLASIRSVNKQYGEAVRILKRAINRSVTLDYRVYLQLGYLLEKLGRDEEALKYLIEAEEMNPLSPAGQLIRKIREKNGGSQKDR
ncbi:MAG: tetratricopeptide repeat protein, partial [Candidatus Latescibacteria bacterium]|nr:tetratricopeptide repeat protein [bacterium]MBD3425499.1 tetratricopeptide repeat protein [Candidatus Latescibacterota bacterium]